MHPSNVWKAAYEGGRKFIEELLIEFAWLTMQDTASACRPIPYANCVKRKLQTAKQLLHSIRMWWTTKERKMQLHVLEN